MKGHRLVRIAAGLLIAALLLLAVAEALDARYSHDEHQFIVPGLLLAQKGLLPYRDFACFHMPYLLVVNGWVAHFFVQKVAVVRVMTAISICGSVWLLGWLVFRRMNGRSPWVGLALAAGLCALFVFGPVWGDVAGHFWNHGAPMLFVLAAVAAHLLVAERKLAVPWLAAGGFALGLAAGMRLTFLPLTAPMGVTAFLMLDGDWRTRTGRMLWFGAGVFVALLPMACLLALYPEQVIFGNLKYPHLSLVWRKYPFWSPSTGKFVDPVRGLLELNQADFAGRSLGRKLRDFAEVTLRGHLPLFACFALVGLPALVLGAIRSRGRDFTAVFLLTALPFVWWGCIAPSRFNPQYYYALMPFLVLACAHGFSLAKPGSWPARGAAIVVAACAVMALIGGRECIGSVERLAHPEQLGLAAYWKDCANIRRLVAGGKVLTVEPTSALEAGREVYPEFAMGEFAWRSAHLIPADKRRKLHLVPPSDLDALLANDPPSAVFLDKHDQELNGPLREYAVRHGFEKILDDTLAELWVAPTAGETGHEQRTDGP